MIERRLKPEVIRLLSQQAAVCLLGPRQVGKTTLALEIAEERDSVYLDLESEADRNRLAEPELFLGGLADVLVVIDEIQRAPDLFESLRVLIDQGRRAGKATGRFLLLGSASPGLLRQSGETLAGRISYVELDPLSVDEIESGGTDRLWVRGGFPDSYLALDESVSRRWREDFIRTYLERDVPQLGPRVPAETLRRFWTMLAHSQGARFDPTVMAASLGLSGPTVTRYLDLMIDLLLVRRLEPWRTNTGKRLVKRPRSYVRDSGLVHALLGLGDLNDVVGHPVAGASWEGFVIENLIRAAGNRVDSTFYRSAGGAEVDLVLTWPDGVRWAVEIKRSLSPKLARGFHSAWQDLEPERGFLVYPGSDRYPVNQAVEAIGIHELTGDLLRTRTS
ncbi:MAG: ATP-binding protein [Solirubrobacterales bacterium]